MAETRISKILARSGPASTVPILDVAELGYATDTNNLYVGNTTLTIGTGDGVTTVFNFAFPYNISNEKFYVDGNERSDITRSTSTVTFGTAPGVGLSITMKYNSKFYAPIGVTEDAALLNGFTTTITAAGTTTLTNLSTQYQVFTGTTTQTIVLPVVSTLTTGWPFRVVNNSTGNLTINSSGGNLVATVYPNMTVYIVCIAVTGTSETSWEYGYTDFGTLTGTGSNVLATAPTINSATLVTPALGTPASGVMTNVTGLPLSTGITGTLAAANGGTGLTTYAVGDLVYASGTTTIAKLADVATGNVLISGGVGVAPSYGKVGLTTHVSGILPVANGGTGVTTAPAEAARLYGFTTTATAAATTTLTNTSSQYQLFTGTTTQTITLPVESTLTTGWTYHIVNNSTGNLTVNSSGSNLVATVYPNMTLMVTCVDIAVTTAAAWEAGYTDFGTVTGTGSNVLQTTPTITTPNLAGNVALTTGNIIVNTSGKGIDFAVVTGGSGTPTANILFDYEEGTFDPTISGAGVSGVATYSPGRAGRYVKIGKMVTVWGAVSITGHTGSGQMLVGGLPFTAATVTNMKYIANIAYLSLTVPASSIAIGFVNSGESWISMQSLATAATGYTLLTLDTACTINFTVSYETA